jgi:hypothetical protein
MYCNFEYTGKQFNNKKVYICKECGITLGLDSPEIKILCFKQQQKLADITYNQLTGQIAENKDIPAGVDLAKFAENELIARSMAAQAEKDKENKEDNLCSQEEINSRLTICNSCEHFKENACMLCGCKIVREANYQNKLAHRNASCPINKWGPIKS